MSRFVIGVLDDLKEECHSAMLNYNMNISRFMVDAQQVEDIRATIKSKDAQNSR